ncbi:MAG: carboxypeptidase-like regulatory domain-containing protein [Bryobacterales bacterium]|nr:carboxypeptidase-like regulatory domain-containing protein [Bryobacterales bacterium]
MRFSIQTTGLLLAALATQCAFGQELRGRVQGVVSDSSGSVIVGAAVTLKNDSTGVAEKKETGGGGQYLFDFVNAGTYSLTVSLQGFRTFVQQNVLVQTRADITVNAAMELGQVSEKITVTEAPVSVQFNTTNMQTTLDSKMSTELPIIHRNPFLLLTLDPSVVHTGNQEKSPYHSFAANDMDVGGGTERNNEILVDGVPNTWGMKNNYTPSMDAVSEMNVQQNATDAEYGHSAGGIISVQMKGGGNEFHGTAYYFGRNPALNAVADSSTHTPSVTRQNVWGFTAGNPISRNRLFNFLSYEGQILSEPRDFSRTLPTPLEREGDFSRSLNANSALRTIFDPFTTIFNQAANTSTRTPFAGNAIPKSRFDPTSSRVLKDVWQPNRPGDDITGVNNFRMTMPNTFRYWNLSNRTDYVINDAWKLFGRFSRFHTIESAPDVTGGSRAQGLGGSQRNGLQAAGDAVWAISPRMVLNLRGAFNKPVDNFADAQSELKSWTELWGGNAWHEPYLPELPQVYYPGITVGASVLGRTSYWYGEPRFWNGSAKLSVQSGRHYLKAGGEYRGIRMRQGAFSPSNFRFLPAHTAGTFINPNTRLQGDAWATFLLGVLDDTSSVQTRPLNEGRNNFYSAYLQDDFKLNQRVTFNLGLRYEYDSPITDARDRLSRYLDLTNPIPEFQGANAPKMPAEVAAIRTAAPVYNGAWVFTDSQNKALYNSPKLTLLPRVGVAIRVNDRTAIRAGWSRYVVPPSINFAGGINILNAVPYPGYMITSSPLPMLEGIPQARFNDPFPSGANPLAQPIGKSFGRYSQLGYTDATIWSYQDLKNAANDRISLTLQRQIFSQIVVDATYFTNRGANHYYQKGLNLSDPRIGFEQKALLARRVDNPFYNILTPQKFPGALRFQKQVRVSDLLAPYPQYGALTQLFTPGIDKRYHAAQIKVQRPFANGFNLLAGYNYHRSKESEFYDTVDTYLDKFTPQESNDPRHKFNLSAIANLPFGRGRKWGADSSAFVNSVFGGWTVSSIYQWVSGAYLRFGAMLVNGDPKLENPTRDRWFNTSVFVRQPDYTRRSNPLQFVGLTGPSLWSWDATLAKTVKIADRLSFEIRAESYNLTNTFIGQNPIVNVDSSQFGRVVTQRPGYYGRQFQYTGRFRW